MNLFTQISVFFWLLCAILHFPDFIGAYDISQRAEPGRLGIQLDFSMARSWPSKWPEDSGEKNEAKRTWVFSTHLTFKNDVNGENGITDKQLTSLAIEAYKEMEELVIAYELTSAGRPSVMTALAYGKEVILTSSQKGRTSYSYNNPQQFKNRPQANAVFKYLDICQKAFDAKYTPVKGVSDRHRTGGRCGEQMAAHAYFRIKPTDDLKERNARVTTVQLDIEEDKGIHAIAPCNTVPKPGEIVTGCKEFAEELSLNVITLDIAEDDRTEAEGWFYDWQTLAGGLDNTIENNPASIDLCIQRKSN